MSSHTKTKKKKRFRVMSQKVKVFRSKNPLLSVLMWGVSHSINELSHVNNPAMLMPDDFKAFTKLRVDNHLFNKENFPSHFKFKEYCPLVFRQLRERFGIDDNQYAASFQSSPLVIPSPGRSGAKFFISKNRKFYVKTIEGEDIERLHNILPQYHHYIVEKHAKTLLPQYLGVYRITVDNKETYLLVMKSVFSSKFKIHKKYDLKGSTVDRQASSKEKTKENPTFKDNDFTKDNAKLRIGDDVKKDLLQRVKDDVEFLTSLNIMDYSLLVGIHDAEAGNDVDDVLEGIDSNEDSEPESPREADSPQESDSPGEAEMPLSDTPPTTPPANFNGARERNISFGSNELDEREDDDDTEGFQSIDENRRELYYLGIIDVLTFYGAGKKAAHAAKTVKHGAGAEISTIKPENYAKRFLDLMERIFA
ncbi:phosphatidylinositol 5-phosphate 4-kinase type-2 alpha-like [Orbicella faveolata]|uniref:phosphatidylinositol 5-phosphate 4-kinase type-2 alpha-like n=1 Tax=Orbicella faveolata TaxID=48498 RepID=UPI0009E32F0D|nr:phosphatidylinositol 5-phosphate 4-kinase type-2 alpha-like [Orbicella faveolata]